MLFIQPAKGGRMEIIMGLITKKEAERRDTDNNILLTGEYYYSSRDQYEFKYKDAYGNPRSKKAKTLDDLRKIENIIEKTKNDQLPVITKNTTVCELVEFYFQVKNNIDDLTRSSYIYFFNRYIVKSSFAQKKIGDVYKVTITEFYNSLITEKNIKKITVKTAQNFLSPAFRLAVDCRAIPSNPCELCMGEVKETVSRERYVFPAKQQIQFLDFVKTYFRSHYAMIKVQLDTGLRVGELCGLTEKDVIFPESYISVNHQLSYRNLNGKPVSYQIKTPKSAAGNRNILFDDDTKECLLEQEKYADLIHTTLNRFEIDGYVNFLHIIASSGNPAVTNTVNITLNKIVDAYNTMELRNAARENRDVDFIPHISSHSLRKSGLSRMAESGLMPKTLQYIAGHESIETTYDYYVKSSNDFKYDDMKKYHQYLQKIEELEHQQRGIYDEK